MIFGYLKGSFWSSSKTKLWVQNRMSIVTVCKLWVWMQLTRIWYIIPYDMWMYEYKNENA